MVRKSFVFCDIIPCSPLKAGDVSEQLVASIFIVEEEAKPETSVKQ
jgi:hypothetical protein